MRFIQQTRIDQARNIRVVEPPEDLPLGAKALLPLKTDPTGMQEFDRNRVFKALINTSCAPDATHAATAEFGLDHVRSNVSAAKGCRFEMVAHVEQRRGQKILITQTLTLGKHISHLAGERRIRQRQRRQPRSPLGLG